MSNPTPTTALRDVIEALDKASPGPLTVRDDNEGDGHPPRPLWTVVNEDYDCASDYAMPMQAAIHYGIRSDADAIAMSVNFLRTHADTIRRALETLAAVEAAPVVRVSEKELWWLQDAINSILLPNGGSHADKLQALHDKLKAAP